MVTTDTNAVELGHVVTCVGEDRLDNAHGGRGRVNVRIAHHVLFQNVILNGSGQLGLLHTLLLRSDDEECKYRQHCSIHRHRDRYFVKWDAAEQCLHIFHCRDWHASHAHIAHHTGVVGIVTTVSG